jgi:uncharacterized protein
VICEQSLAGRVAIFNLLPFSLGELDASPYRAERYETYLVKGFYPRIYDKGLNPTTWLSDYVQTYVERDVRQLINLTEAEIFRQFLELCAGRIGQLVNFSEMGNALGISHQTVRRWLSILETSYIVYTLRPYHRNFQKRIVKSPKLYFYDTGLACALFNIRDEAQYRQHFAQGALFENFVINEISKLFHNQGQRPRLYFWRDSNGHEVGLLIDEGMVLHPVEIKSGKTVQPDFFKGLSFFNQLAGIAPHQSYLIYGGTERQKRSQAQVLGWRDLAEVVTGFSGRD